MYILLLYLYICKPTKQFKYKKCDVYLPFNLTNCFEMTVINVYWRIITISNIPLDISGNDDVDNVFVKTISAQIKFGSQTYTPNIKKVDRAIFFLPMFKILYTESIFFNVLVCYYVDI